MGRYRWTDVHNIPEGKGTDFHDLHQKETLHRRGRSEELTTELSNRSSRAAAHRTVVRNERVQMISAGQWNVIGMTIQLIK